jgi:regulator of RNase E activity RraB
MIKSMSWCLIILVTAGLIGCDQEPGKERIAVAPEDVEYQKQKDLEVITALKKHGSDMSKPHLIEHHFIAYSREDGAELLRRGKLDGFQVSDLKEGEWEGRRYYYFDLMKPTIPTIENIFSDSSLMLDLALEFNCEYDGWGCEVVE